ncbi:MAG: insulinase family protein [Nitrococcus mobilis]|nr:insulinase family protein [Nitrococcus mobilis]
MFKTLARGVLLGFGLLAAVGPTATAANQPANTLRATLDNGLRVVIVRDALAPVVTTQITYLAGSYQVPQRYPGTAHALEHMLFRGSKGLSAAQLDKMTGTMGGVVNAFTTNDATQYYFVTPASYLDVLLHIEATRMRGALLTDKAWALEKGAIEQEVSRDISDPGYLAFQQAQRILYAGTGYAENPLGTRPSFDRTTTSILRRFYNDWYVPDNATFVIVGDVEPPAALAKIKRLFGPIAAHPAPARAVLALQPVKPQTIRMTTPAATGSVQFLYRMPGMASKDYAAAQILMDVLNNARSPLAELAAQGKVLSADAQTLPFSHGGIGVVEVGFPKGGNARQARLHLEQIITDLLEDGVSPELVEAAKCAELAQFEFAKNSAATLASAWSQVLAWQGLDSPAQAAQQIRTVSVAAVDRLAQEYLKPDQRVTIVLTPSAKGKRPPQSSGFGGTESFAGDNTLDVPLPAWASQALAKLELPHWTLDPVQMKLANGINLIVQPESVSQTLTVIGHIDHNAGLQEPRGQDGVGRLLATLFDYGTTTLDRGAFHKALDDIAARVTSGTEFSLAVPSKNFDRGLQLLADNELHPALPQRAFTVQRDTLARTLTGELESPRYRMIRALKQALLPSGDPGLREATPDTVGELTLQDVQDYFAASYRPDLTTIVVVGDIAPEQAKVTIEKYFGDWHAHGPKPEVVPPRVPLNPPGYTVVPNAYASQNQALMGQMLDLDLHNPDRYALQLGNDVLGGSGFASRLMADIRVRHGYAYSVGSAMNFDRSRSIFYVQYGSDPDKVARIDALVRQSIEALRTQPVAADELDNARQYEIRSIPLEISSVERIARSLLAWSWRGEPLDQPMVAGKHYLTLTPQQVRAAFEKYVKPQHLTQVVQGPAPPGH